MKILDNGTNKYGPFNNITVLEDRYLCDGIEYQFSIVNNANIKEYIGPFIDVNIVPDFVSPRQIRQAMTRANLRDIVENKIAEGDQDIKDWYEYATTFERINPHVLVMGQALGVSDAQLDDLWRLAGSL